MKDIVGFILFLFLLNIFLGNPMYITFKSKKEANKSCNSFVINSFEVASLCVENEKEVK